MCNEDKNSRQPEKHQPHMCKLRKKGLMMDLDRLAANPTVACAKCGEQAALAEAVCQPKALREG